MKTYKYYNKITKKMVTSSHAGTSLAERELGLNYGTLRFQGEVKTNALGNDSTEQITFNPKIYPSF